jgi:hypothetical protein
MFIDKLGFTIGLIFLGILALALLSGCSKTDKQIKEKKEELKVVGTFKNVKVISKEYKPCARCVEKWYVTVEKNNEQVQLQLFGEDAYDVLKRGTHVNLKYTKNYFVKEIEFVNFKE